MNRSQRKKENKKRKIIGKILVVVAFLIIITCSIIFLKKDNKTSQSAIPAQSVKNFIYTNNLFQNRYSGIVETANVTKIKKDDSKTIKEEFVKQGDKVTKGQKLFEYDTSETKIKVEQENLEIEKMQNMISNYKKQIENYNEEKAANPDDKSIDLEIQSLNNDIKQTEYNIKSKKVEVDNLKKSINNSAVVSEIDGIIQSINNEENSNLNNASGDTESNAYITIIQVGEFRIKGSINELNMGMIAPGQKVIIRSRRDENKTWSGTVDSVDSSPEKNTDNFYYGNSDSSTTSSKYPFYISLENKEGLMLGEHVFIELDYGIEEKEGIWIPNNFIVSENDKSYVWIADGNKAKMSEVTLGEVDEDLFETKIESGITEDDYIIEPQDGLVQGAKVEKYDFLDNSQNFEEDLEENPEMIEENMPSSDIVDGDNVQTDMQIEGGDL